MTEIGTADFDIRQRTVAVLNHVLAKRKYDVIVLVTKRGLCLYEACKDKIVNPPDTYSDIFLYTNRAARFFVGKTVLLFDDAVRYGRHLARITQRIKDLGADKTGIDACVIAKYYKYNKNGDKVPVMAGVALTKSDLDIFAKRSLSLFYLRKVPYLRFLPRAVLPFTGNADDFLSGYAFEAQRDALTKASGCRCFIKYLSAADLLKKVGNSFGGLIKLAYLEAFLFERDMTSCTIVPRVTLKPIPESELDKVLDAFVSAVPLDEDAEKKFRAHYSGESGWIKYHLITYLLSLLVFKRYMPGAERCFDFSQAAVHFGGDCKAVIELMYRRLPAEADFGRAEFAVLQSKPTFKAVPDGFDDMKELYAWVGIADGADEENRAEPLCQSLKNPSAWKVSWIDLPAMIHADLLLNTLGCCL